MLSRSKNANTPDELLSDNSNIDEVRAQRVWHLVNVAWMTWFFFTGYCWLRGYSQAAFICFLETLAISVIIRANRSRSNYRRIMNLSLGACATGLLFVSTSHPDLHLTMLFYPVSILIASQLLGVRAAFQWLVVSLVSTVLFFLITYGLHDLILLKLDEMTLVCGVSVCVFFCCQQGEEFYRERTRGLIDLSQRLRTKGKRLHKLATTDSLTGLLNRFQFQRELQDKVRRASASNQRMAMLLIDMDGFKEINDTLGHPVGDQALVEIASRLRQEFQEEAVVSRLGGDEFCLIFPDVGSAERAEMFAQKACEVLTARYVLDELDFPMGTSVGFALCPDHTKSATDLLAFADTAMFYAKEKRLGYSSYEPEMTKRLVEYRSMQEQLSFALERNEFFLVYQPQVSLESGKIIGVEALLRWRRDGEVISPDRFIPLLEKSREIIPVGRWIIREACRQLRAWSDAGLDLEVSINVSSIQFHDDDFHTCIADPLEEFGLDASKLDFEITESLLIEDVSQAIERLSEIKQLGASISIDDFGTGYSSLAYLRHFPLDRLKIDRAFVQDIPEADDGVIAMSIVALSKAIGLKVLAEGVETREQLDFLKSIDCDEIQGYFFSRPVEAEKIASLFENQTALDAITPTAVSN